MKIPFVSLLVACCLAGACTSTPFRAEHPAPASPPVAKPAPAPAEKAPPAPATSAESRLANGIQAYENGNYATSQQELQAALDLGLPEVADRVTANKTLAFIACAMRQFDTCKGRFRRVLALNPKFSLTAAEAGHPVWGPVFKDMKGEMGAKAPASAPGRTAKRK